MTSIYVLQHIKKIESLRNSRVLILAASHLDNELLPALKNQLDAIGKVDTLDVLIHSRGGVVNAARRIALLLRKYALAVNFIVPYYCESSGTILALSGNEIIAGDLAMFTPIDPHLHGGVGDGNSALSCLDIKQFGQMCEEWFGVDPEQANAEQVSLLCNSIFPPTLTAFYRTARETQAIAEELLSYQLSSDEPHVRSKIVEHLMYEYHSHHYAITKEEMSDLGLNCQSNNDVEQLAWEISVTIQSVIGGGVRQSIDEPYSDALIISKESSQIRSNPGNGLLPQWGTLELL